MTIWPRREGDAPRRQRRCRRWAIEATLFIAAAVGQAQGQSKVRAAGTWVSRTVGAASVRIELEEEGATVRGRWTPIASAADPGSPRQVVGELLGDTLVLRDRELRVVLLEGVIRGDDIDARVAGAGRMRSIGDGRRLGSESHRVRFRRERE